MEVFGDDRPVTRGPVNIHSVLDHVKTAGAVGLRPQHPLRRRVRSVAAAGAGQPDQLIQVFLNLVKNAAEAVGDLRSDAEIQLTTAFRPGVRLSVPGKKVERFAAARILRQGQRPRRAGRPAAEPVRPVRDDQADRHAASGWPWSPRSSAITAASSSANPSHGGPHSACCCPCSIPPNSSTKATAMAFRGRYRLPHRTQDEEQPCPQVAFSLQMTIPPSARF